jgi:protein-S-isoprenylcysteine O-methyltransferase Ste14
MKTWFTRRLWPAIWQAFSRSFILLGLPLLAWGGGDLARFFSHPARAAYAAAVGLHALILACQVYFAPYEPAHHGYDGLPKWQSYMFELTLIIAAYSDARSALTWDENAALRWVGLGVYLLGSALSLWSNQAWTLRLRSMGAEAAGHSSLLTSGPFRWIRHPYLLTLFFYCTGVSLLYRSWLGLVLLVPLTAAVINRINHLERELARDYGRAWMLRCQTSKRILPFLY